LTCSCRDPTFSGVPCRHLLALVSKSSDINFGSLVFNERWKKSYYIQAADEEMNKLYQIQGDEEEKCDSMEKISKSEEILNDFDEVSLNLEIFS